MLKPLLASSRSCSVQLFALQHQLSSVLNHGLGLFFAFSLKKKCPRKETWMKFEYRKRIYVSLNYYFPCLLKWYDTDLRAYGFPDAVNAFNTKWSVERREGRSKISLVLFNYRFYYSASSSISDGNSRFSFPRFLFISHLSQRLMINFVFFFPGTCEFWTFGWFHFEAVAQPCDDTFDKCFPIKSIKSPDTFCEFVKVPTQMSQIFLW